MDRPAHFPKCTPLSLLLHLLLKNCIASLSCCRWRHPHFLPLINIRRRRQVRLLHRFILRHQNCLKTSSHPSEVLIMQSRISRKGAANWQVVEPRQRTKRYKLLRLPLWGAPLTLKHRFVCRGSLIAARCLKNLMLCIETEDGGE